MLVIRTKRIATHAIKVDKNLLRNECVFMSIADPDCINSTEKTSADKMSADKLSADKMSADKMLQIASVKIYLQ